MEIQSMRVYKDNMGLGETVNIEFICKMKSRQGLDELDAYTKENFDTLVAEVDVDPDNCTFRNNLFEYSGNGVKKYTLTYDISK